SSVPGGSGSVPTSSLPPSPGTPGEGRGEGQSLTPEEFSKAQLRKESFYRCLELARRCNATVNVTFWHGPYPDPDAAAQACTDALTEIIRDRGFTNVQYVTLQNEVNLTKIPSETYDQLYKSFDRDLRSAGLRDKIKIIGGDLTGEHQEKW